MMKSLLIAASVCVGMASIGLAADKPNELKIGITTFMSGPASVFGVPGKASAELIIEEWNRKGGIGGVPVKLFFVNGTRWR
jgi:branched-chain amino acid transport system substrate-binding protein